MALYEVSRTDEVLPGEFGGSLVIASGTALARKAFADHPGVTSKNLVARRIDTASKREAAVVLATTYEPEAESPEDTLFDYEV